MNKYYKTGAVAFGGLVITVSELSWAVLYTTRVVVHENMWWSNIVQGMFYELTVHTLQVWKLFWKSQKCTNYDEQNQKYNY